MVATFFGEHCIMYKLVGSLYFSPETNVGCQIKIIINKLNIKGNISYSSIYKPFWKRQNCRDGKEILGFQRLVMEGNVGHKKKET